MATKQARGRLMHLLDYFNPDGPPTALFEIGPACETCGGIGYVNGDDECPHCEGTGDRYGRGPTKAAPAQGQKGTPGDG
jgi:hypothetical protein